MSVERIFARRGPLRSACALAFCLLASMPWAAQATTLAVLQQPAIPTAKAKRAVLLGLTRAGERLVAVGERGIVLLSDDAGVNWRQAQCRSASA
jgi:photosystem II stability/assembly factor-like uncharacterized protein